MSAAEFLAALAEGARAAIEAAIPRSIAAGPAMHSIARLRQSEGGSVPDLIADDLARSRCSGCGADGAPRVAIRSHYSGAHWLGCVACAPGAIADQSELAGWLA